MNAGFRSKKKHKHCDIHKILCACKFAHRTNSSFVNLLCAAGGVNVTLKIILFACPARALAAARKEFCVPARGILSCVNILLIFVLFIFLPFFWRPAGKTYCELSMWAFWCTCALEHNYLGMSICWWITAAGCLHVQQYVRLCFAIQSGSNANVPRRWIDAKVCVGITGEDWVSHNAAGTWNLTET